MRSQMNDIEQSLSCSTHMMKPYVEQIMELTLGMVENAMQCHWYELMDQMDERAQLMNQLAIMAGDSHAGIVTALSKAVSESERAMNQIMAHAIATARWPGAEHCLGL